MGLSLYQKQKIQSLIKPTCITIVVIGVITVSIATVTKLRNSSINNDNEVSNSVDVSSNSDNHYEITEVPITTVADNSKSSVVDCYTGSYSAGQGNTQLDFTITYCDSDYNSEALFLFYASDSNPSIPTGSYKVKGTLIEKYDDGSAKVYFEGTEWIQKPSTYSFVNFTAIVNPNTHTISSSDYSVNLTQKSSDVNSFFDDHQYCLFDTPMDAEEAEVVCKAMGGHLVSINSSEEQRFFEDMIQQSKKDNIWTGGYYDGNEWKWTDNSVFNYTKWDEGRPDNYWGDEFYIKVANVEISYPTWTMHKFNWDDVSKIGGENSSEVPMSSFGFVCEWGNTTSDSITPSIAEDIPESTIAEFTDFYSSIKEITASSQLSEETIGNATHNYAPSKVIDNDLSTCWCEGKEDYGIGENLTIKFNDTYRVGEFTLWNGLCTNEDLYQKNSRVHSIRLIFSDGTSLDFDCKNGWGNRKNTFTFPEKIDTSFITFQILDVYEGEKYKDTCISEISVS